MQPKTIRRKNNTYHLVKCFVCGREKYSNKKTVKVCSKKCYSKYYIGEKHPRWNGGKSTHSGGYLTVRISQGVYRLAHRIIYEKHIGRKLKKCEVVHHIDGNKKNNNVDNLQIMSNGQHHSHHAKLLYENKLGPIYKLNHKKYENNKN